MEIVTDLANTSLLCNQPSQNHKLDNQTEAVVILDSRPFQPPLSGLSRDPYLRCSNTNHMAYVDVFVNEFLGLAQDPSHSQRHVWRTLFHALDKVFQTLDFK